MSAVEVAGCALLGVDAVPVRVEVDLRPGLPVLSIVGLPDRAVSESARRVRAALSNSGFRLPPRRITVNLAPADVPKHGAGLDLPIAAGLMVASGHVAASRLNRIGMWGQLSLDGGVRPAAGCLSAAISMRDAGLQAIAVAEADSYLAGLAGITVHVTRTLGEIASPGWPRKAFADRSALPVRPAGASASDESTRCYRRIRGLQGARRVLLLAAAGMHSLCLLGPPGTGKSMIARALHALLPEPGPGEMVDIARVAGAWGQGPVLTGAGLEVRRPLRTPPHTAGVRAMFGGGSPPVPGEVTLAHGGVLVLDELPLFRPEVLTGVCRALDLGSVTLRGGRREVTLPARFQLAATANLCPCGRTGAPDGGCACTPAMRKNHYRRMSAGLLDRVDIHLEIAGTDVHELSAGGCGEDRSGAGLEEVRAAVDAAREVQAARYGRVAANATVVQEFFDSAGAVSRAAWDLLGQVQDRLGLSVRACLRVLRVARTAADLEQSEIVMSRHVAEAGAYRWRPPL